ncbi:MAG: hypothetical protein AAF791_15410 [Bacteroidota bacterium]
MIATAFACLVVYAAGALAAPAAGWEGIRFAFSAPAPPVARSLLISAIEALVGFGTMGVAVALSVWTLRADTYTLVAAGAVGIGFGIARSLRSAKNAATLEAAARNATTEDTEALQVRLGGIVRSAVIVRALAATTVPLATALWL